MVARDCVSNGTSRYMHGRWKKMSKHTIYRRRKQYRGFIPCSFQTETSDASPCAEEYAVEGTQSRLSAVLLENEDIWSVFGGVSSSLRLVVFAGKNWREYQCSGENWRWRCERWCGRCLGGQNFEGMRGVRGVRLLLRAAPTTAPYSTHSSLKTPLCVRG